ncbi:hypothetical protein Poli38472_009682 [Pythium oligandrum]|uniref:Protein kinase domain-containing protein n=1 Tax=Pythium oligandrum TaxID=41045 RepID=A0A8K1FIK9_PYTOL|nr:hypothetical protein Poli38472_009682 [Pythium oligandrum]|eukprot:TMW62189.1 hypothetical protein Poli38472_009682 [Pythium oligandrum]
MPTRTLRIPTDGRVRGFYHLCGSPIRVGKHMTYDDQGEGEGDRSPSLAAADPQPDVENQEEDASEARDLVDNVAQLMLHEAQEMQIPLYMSKQYTKPEPREERKASRVVESKVPRRHKLGSLVTIQMEEIKFGHMIGEGAFGRVYKAMWKRTRVAVKILHSNLTDDVVDEFEKELSIMSLLHHPNICRLLGAVLQSDWRALVVELVDRGSLWHVLRSHNTTLTPLDRAKFVLDTARGMKYLHHFNRPILHRDMKSPNLLVQNDFTIKISDFGLSRVKTQIQTMTGSCGTVQWMAPEVLGNRKYTEKADVYSFGIVVWEIFTGECPYDGMSPIQVGLGVLNRDLRPNIPLYLPRFFTRLMRMCWAREPERRPSFEEIVEALDEHFKARMVVH